MAINPPTQKPNLHFIVPVVVYEQEGVFYSRKQTFLFESLARFFTLHLYVQTKPLPSEQRHLYTAFTTAVVCHNVFIDCSNRHFLTHWNTYRSKLRGLPVDELYFFIFPMDIIGMAVSWLLRDRNGIVWVRSDTEAVHNSRYLRWYDGITKGVMRTLLNPIKNVIYRFVARRVTRNNLVFYSGNITINPQEHRNQYELISPPDYHNRPTVRAIYPQKRICFVGGEDPRKGLTVLLQALQQLPNPNQYQLDIIGLTELKEQRNQKHATGLSINFLGAVYDRETVYKTIAQSDILVMPSFAEKQGKVQLEAMAVGTVPICSDSGGTYTTIKHLHNGLLVTPGDHLELAVNITKLYDEPELYHELQKNGRLYSARIENDDVFSFIHSTTKKFFALNT